MPYHFLNLAKHIYWQKPYLKKYAKSFNQILIPTHYAINTLINVNILEKLPKIWKFY